MRLSAIQSNIFLCAYLLFNPIFFYALICYSIQYFFMRLFHPISAIQYNIFLCAYSIQYLLFNTIFFMRLFHPISAIQYYIFYALICYSIHIRYSIQYIQYNIYNYNQLDTININNINNIKCFELK